VLLEAVVQVVGGTVHRLEREVVRLGLAVEHEEHVLPVLAPVTAHLPQALVEEERGLHLLVAVLEHELPHEAREDGVECGALGGPEGGPGRERVEVEEIELRAQPAVVALLGLLPLREPRLQRLPVEERGAVDALEHRVPVIASPVRPGTRQQLDDAHPARRGTVRPQAEVDPVTVRVEGEGPRPLGHDVLDDLDLEGLALGLEEGDGVGGRHLRALEGEIAGDDGVRLGLDPCEVVGGERRVAREVVVEAVLDRRTDGHLGAGEEPLDRVGHDVRRVVADDFQRLGVLAGEDLEGRVLLQRPREIDGGAVQLGNERALGEPGPDGVAHEVGDAGTLRRLLLAAVGKCHGHHVPRHRCLLGLRTTRAARSAGPWRPCAVGSCA
jgi:hypothetical protein